MTVNDKNCHVFSISVLTAEQLRSCLDFIRNSNADNIARIYVNSDLILGKRELSETIRQCTLQEKNVEWILALPEILRKQDHDYLKRAEDLIGSTCFSGILTGSLEGVGYFSAKKEAPNGKKIKIYGDHNLYLWNSQAVNVWMDLIDGGCLPLELRWSEQKELINDGISWEKMIYGRIPMMLTANCIAKTSDQCQKKEETPLKLISLKDRMGKEFPVRLCCEHCFNVIYNSVPLSLHQDMEKYDEKVLLRIQFTTENGSQTDKVLKYFAGGNASYGKPPYDEFTKGHEKRGAE